jgi:class 3 adenylate cyclase
MGPRTTRYATSGGVNIAYQVFGSGELTVVDVGGFATHIELVWDHPGVAALYERLARYARVVIFDKRGCGLSDRVVDVPSLEQRVADIRAVIDDVGVERVVLYGTGDGGAVSILFAGTHPERTQALVLAGSFARFARAADYPVGEVAEEWTKLVPLLEEYWGTGHVLATMNPAVERDPTVLANAARFERNSVSRGFAAALLRMNLDIDVRNVLPHVRVPTFVVHNQHDPAVPVGHGRYLAAHIANARYLELQDHQHGSAFRPAVPEWHDDLEEFLTGERPPPRPDRVLATLLFTDIVGSTVTSEQLGDESWRALLDHHDQLVYDAISRFAGRHVAHTGDGVSAIFDRPARAIECALEIQRQLNPFELHVRAGVHVGEIEVRGDAVAGVNVHIAARICALADTNEILVSRVVKELAAGSGFRFIARGEHVLKGVKEPQTLYSASAQTQA